jgi:hypothetical protein
MLAGTGGFGLGAALAGGAVGGGGDRETTDGEGRGGQAGGGDAKKSSGIVHCARTYNPDPGTGFEPQVKIL